MGEMRAALMAHGRRFAVFLFFPILLRRVVQAELPELLQTSEGAEGWPSLPTWHKPSYQITDENWKAVVAALATPQQQIMFSTFTGADNTTKLANTNLFFWAHQAGVAHNLLLMSTDEASCAGMWEVGVPCWIDNICPRIDALPQSMHQIKGAYCKYWWATQLTKSGYSAHFLSNDVILFQDPFEHSDSAQYDIEGLSDYIWLPDRPTPQDLLRQPCPIYKSVPDTDTPGRPRPTIEGMYLGHGETLEYSGMFPNGITDESVVTSMSPCISSGLFFAHPHNTTVAFLEDMLYWMTVQRPGQWEQAGLQQVLTAHLISGRDSEETLRFRLLPLAKFESHAGYAARLESNRTLETVALRPWYVGGPSNQPPLEEMGLWKPDQWRGEWGAQLKERFLLCLDDAKAPSCSKKLMPRRRLRHPNHNHTGVHPLSEHYEWIEARKQHASPFSPLPSLSRVWKGGAADGDITEDRTAESYGTRTVGEAGNRHALWLPSADRDATNPELAAVLRRVAIDNEVMATLSNRKYAGKGNMLEIWMQNVQRAGVRNAIVLALDADTKAHAESEGMAAFEVHVEIPEVQASEGEVHAVSGLKFKVLQQLLTLGYSVLLSDVDVITLQNPFDHLYRDSDLEGSSDGWTNETAYGQTEKDGEQIWFEAYSQRSFFMNSGFFYIRPTKASMDLLTMIAQRLATTAEWDQKAYNEAIFFPSHNNYADPSVTRRVMDYLEFMNSKTLFGVVRHEPRYKDLLPVTVHVNYQHADTKCERMEAIVRRFVDGDELALDGFKEGSWP